jgi:S-formylglutathione hydrolase FrmB
VGCSVASGAAGGSGSGTSAARSSARCSSEFCSEASCNAPRGSRAQRSVLAEGATARWRSRSLLENIGLSVASKPQPTLLNSPTMARNITEKVFMSLISCVAPNQLSLHGAVSPDVRISGAARKSGVDGQDSHVIITNL